MAGSASPRTIRVERSDRRVRVRAGGEWVADTTSALLMLEQGLVPVYYLPRSDVRMELLAPAAKRTRCETKGEAAYYTLRAGTFVAEDAAWSYESPIPGREQLSRYISFYWNRVEQWFEEDEEIFVHPRDPHKRVDAIRSSRHVRVVIAGETVAETTRPVLLFETGLPTRYYLPAQDVRLDLLEPSESRTQCPYKGVASYHSVNIGGELFRDVVWSYPFPIPECPKIEGLLAFYNERIELYVDGERQEQPPRRAR